MAPGVPTAPPTAVRDHLPAEARVHAIGGSEQADVWRADFDGGPRWIKVHRHPPHAAREAEALTVAAAVAGYTPRLVATIEPATLVLSHVAGEPWSSTAALPASAWSQLARWLVAWHAQPVAVGDPVDPGTAYATRFTRARQAVGDALGTRLAASVDACVDPTVFVGRRRGWCHRDLSLDNLRWSVDHGLGVIDFGQARADVWPTDLAKLWADPRVDATSRRALVDALPQGLSAVDEACLRQAVLLHGLVTLGWGVRHRVAARVDEGRRVLADATATRGPPPRGA